MNRPDSRAALTVVRRELLSDGENAALFGWSSAIFGSTFGLTWRAPAFHVVGLVHGAPVSHVGGLTHTVHAGGREVRVGGVGAVVTLPAFRGRGFAETLLRAAADGFAAEGLAFAVLFCPERMLPYYSRLGWKPVDDAVTVLQNGSALRCPVPAMTLALSGAQWPTGPVVVNSEPW